MIGIIDYGMGNIRAFANILKNVGVPHVIAQRVEELDGVSKVILPGVGAFDHAMERLNASGMRERIDHLVVEKKLPVLGICVGMQIMANSSEEGVGSGLSWIAGSVKRLVMPLDSRAYSLPH